MSRHRSCSSVGSASRDQAHQAGLSLVEVLVTLAIAALASALILGTARPVDPLRTEVERLANVIDMLEQRAWISGRPTGLQIDESTYSSVIWVEGAWTNVAGQTHELKRGLRLRLATPDAAAQGPQIVFDPLDHSSTSEIVLSSGAREMTVPLPDRASGGPK